MKFETNNFLDIVMYPIVVKNLADGFFDDDWNYDPAFGRINAMGMYYKICVTKSDYDEIIPHNVSDMMELKDLLADGDFCKAFDDAVWDENYGLTFGKAYSDAIRLVESRKSPANIIANTINKVTETLSSIVTEETLAVMSELSSAIKSGKMDADAFVESYGKSSHYQELMNQLSNINGASNEKQRNSSKKSTAKKSTKSKNVVPMKPKS